MLVLIIFWSVLLIGYAVLGITHALKDVKSRELFAQHMLHISAVFHHERGVAEMYRRSKIKHWSVGCEELRQSTMLEE